MRSFGPRTRRALSIAAALLLAAPLAHAAELFVTGDLGISSGTGDSSASNSLAPGDPFSSGDGSDSSQVWGAGMGMAVPMSGGVNAPKSSAAFGSRFVPNSTSQPAK